MSSTLRTALTDEELFAKILAHRAKGEDSRPALGDLCERWRDGAYFVISRVQASLARGAPEDQGEIFHEAVAKFISRGLDTFRGVSEQMPGRAASPKTFFLRIVKHVAIDTYRKQREELGMSADDSDDDQPEFTAESAQAVAASKRAAERRESSELYWLAFERLKKEHPNEATAWDLYHHQDVDDHQVCADRLQISVTNSYKRVSRAQAYLKLYLLEVLSEGDKTP